MVFAVDREGNVSRIQSSNRPDSWFWLAPFGPKLCLNFGLLHECVLLPRRASRRASRFWGTFDCAC